MSDIMTRIHLPKSKHGGIAEWGRKSAEEMISEARNYGACLKERGEELLSAPDENTTSEGGLAMTDHKYYDIDLNDVIKYNDMFFEVTGVIHDSGRLFITDPAGRENGGDEFEIPFDHIQALYKEVKS